MSHNLEINSAAWKPLCRKQLVPIKKEPNPGCIKSKNLHFQATSWLTVWWCLAQGQPFVAGCSMSPCIRHPCPWGNGHAVTSQLHPLFHLQGPSHTSNNDREFHLPWKQKKKNPKNQTCSLLNPFKKNYKNVKMAVHGKQYPFSQSVIKKWMDSEDYF